MDPARIVTDLDTRFSMQGTEERAIYMKKYLKSALEFRGIDTAGIRSECDSFATANPDLTRAELISLLDNCWRKPVYELRTFGLGLVSRYERKLVASHMVMFEEMLRKSDNWAHVDGISTGPCAVLAARYPELGSVLDRWVNDEDFWIRRASMLALLPPLRRGGGDFDRFARYADRLLDEQEFFIRKAIGWILRETSKKRPELVYEFVSGRVDRISGTTIREAVKYLPTEQSVELMEAYRTR